MYIILYVVVTDACMSHVTDLALVAGQLGPWTTRPVDSSAHMADNSVRKYRTTRPVDSIILNACLESKLIKY